MAPRGPSILLVLDGFPRHLEDAFSRVVAAREPSAVHERASLYACHLVQVGVPQAAPSLWERLAVAELAQLLGHARDAPLLLPVVLEDAVEDPGGLALRRKLLLEVDEVALPGAVPGQFNDLPARVYTQAVSQAAAHNGPGREPSARVVLELGQELAPDKLAGLIEPRVLALLAAVFVPLRIEGGHSVSDGGFAQVLPAQGRAVVGALLLPVRVPLRPPRNLVLVDAVVDGVHRLHEVLVHLEVERVQVWVVHRQPGLGRHDLPPEVLVDEAGAAELGAEPMAEGFVESPLVVVVPVLLVAVDGAHVDQRVHLRVHLGVAGSRHARVSEARRPPQQEAPQRLVRVEGPRVRPDPQRTTRAHRHGG
eukprot:CAMPEP_0198237002 /NCGR_PEP_ID=MMETSP1446-20131203/2852_1 /TAXON_ID=1461542 ORGANISM="Unidentified sp, Strain CCMP2111" /NCGR_SAMPLE_ID=MMETSP1446 /ASSEMBLY_ACC=CAM_ASM_001112 /LENGTH=364 /DNA_ID=CAMNT_0043918981 /DNA_START=225 /DNA_END=1315 /DNA_ORIENTATION=-